VKLGNALFLAGAILEYIALPMGVDTRAVAWSLILYGIILLGTGYVSR
jgi:hypothetical protein